MRFGVTEIPVLDVLLGLICSSLQRPELSQAPGIKNIYA